MDEVAEWGVVPHFPVDDLLYYEDPEKYFQELAKLAPESYRTPTPITFSEAALRQQRGSGTIFDSWTLLRAMIERHETTIRKRWLKRTRDQRKKILLAAWPDMPLLHRPDLALYAEWKTWIDRSAYAEWKTRIGNSADRSAYLWPYINLENLCGPRLFLLLINSRARNQPYLFANADFTACQIGRFMTTVDEVLLAHHVMVFTGRTTAVTYGQLICWKDDPDASKLEPSGRGLGVGAGLLVLECQARLYTFLLRCCKELLPELPETLRTGTDAPIQPEPETLKSSESGLASMSLDATEAPYRVPAQLDVSRLLSIMQAKLSEAEDHVWALRQDPGYFASVLKDLRTHGPFDRYDIEEDRPPCGLSEPWRPYLPWYLSGVSLVTRAFFGVKTYKALVDKLDELEKLTTRYSSHIKPESPLPDEYAFSLYDLLNHLERMIAYPIELFRLGFLRSPVAQACLAGSSDRRKKEFLRAIQGFFDQRINVLQPGVLLHQIERLQTDNEELRQSISPWVAASLSEIAVLWHCQEQIRLLQPWAATFGTEMEKRHEALKKAYQSTRECTTSHHKISIADSVHLLHFFVDREFRYPADEPRTKANVNIMRQAERRLDKFWSGIDGKLAVVHGSSRYIQSLLSARSLERTPAWGEGRDARDREQKVITSNGSSQLVGSLLELHIELERRTERTIDRNEGQTSNKIKEKTRRVSTVPPCQTGVDAIQAPAESEARFLVDRRALRVFKTIFHNPTVGCQPGEICWLDFVHALCSVGFLAEKLYGSAWHFKPQRPDIQRSIQFHEPHPGNKLRFLMARRYGRRLARAYGWHGNMFGLQTK